MSPQTLPFGDDGVMEILRGNRSPGRCGRCGRRVIWVMAAGRGKNVPFDAEPFVIAPFENDRGVKFDRVSRRHIHFASCPAKANQPRCINAEVRHATRGRR